MLGQLKYLILLIAVVYPNGIAKSAIQSTKSQYPLLGISTNLPEGASADRLGYEILDTRKYGVNFIYLSFKWSDVETTPGHPDIDNYRKFLQALAPYGFRFAITLQTIDTNNKTLPSDLMNIPFNSPQMISRFDKLLTALVKIIPPSVKWINLGNEVDVYLQQHPKDIDPFMDLMRHATHTLHQLKPSLQVGITCTFTGASADKSLFDRINQYTDFISLTYYPLHPDFTVRPVKDIPGDFQTMMKLAGKKRVLMQEVGYPASQIDNSSEEKQSEFVNAVFASAKKYRNKLIGINFFLLYDFGDKFTNELLKYYRLPDPRFRAYLATLGLRKSDGTPRKAWLRFQKGYSASQ